MRSGRQRSAELKQRRLSKRGKDKAAVELSRAKKEAAERAAQLKGQVVVNEAALGRNVSYGLPDFVKRGYYVDQPFRCRDCGKLEVWTPTQQKWWYETAKGDMWTTAVRCRPCRRRERDRVAEARRIQIEGMTRKKIHEA